MKNRRYVRLAVLALVLLAAAWFLPSWIHADRYRRRLQANLQQALGRPVRFGGIYLRLLPRPGFSIDNATVLEDPAFGSEAFARVDHIDCDLAAGSFLKGHIALARLHLQGAAINLVRNASGQWNVGHLATGAAAAASASSAAPPDLAIDVSDSRLNFKWGADKKPFAVTALNGALRLDRKRRGLNFDLTGSPLRTDLGLPTPGAIQVQGSWLPDPSGEGSLKATLRSRGALVYDWIPMLLGRNPGIYGLLDLDAHLTGSLAVLDVDAQARLSQLRRWESLPPSGDLPVSVTLQGTLNRSTGEASVGSLKAGFGNSHLSLRGNVTGLGHDPALDLSAAADNSRLEDFVAFGTRLKGPLGSMSFPLPQPLGLSGPVDGLVSIKGSWSEPLFSGSIRAAQARLTLGSASLPASDLVLQCEGREISLLPVRIAAGPRLSLLADGVWRLHQSSPQRRNTTRGASPSREHGFEPGYRLTVSAHSVPGHDLVGFARNAGLKLARDLDLQGPVTATLSLTAAADSESRPALSGIAELHSDALLLPGLVEPLPVQDARISLEGDHVLINPITANFAGSVITARMAHSGPRSVPWTFEAHANSIDLAEALAGFEAFGHHAPVPWFERIPGLDTLASRRAAGTGLFNVLNARGQFSTPLMKYGRVSLRNLSARAEISKRDLRVTGAGFRISSGRGEASANFDLSGPSPDLSTSFEIQGLRVENWTTHLPPQLAELRGTASFRGRFSSEGSSRGQLESSLQGRAQLSLTNLDFGHFDPIRGAAQTAAWGDLAPTHGPVTLRSADLMLAVRERHVDLEPLKIELGGASMTLAGDCDFGGVAQFESNIDLRHVNRRWLADQDPDVPRFGRFLLSGDLNALRATIEDPSAQARR
jgi:hypothetical protein